MTFSLCKHMHIVFLINWWWW